MPFWRKDKDSNGSNAEKVNYKARLEHKQYLAQESPEPVYDISECGLKSVPAGVYSKCKVLRKEAILLQNNELTSLTSGGILSDLSTLQVLDLRSNCLEKLPDEICSLKELKVLYVSNNKLKKLPENLGHLTRLESLDLANNSLKDLPASLCALPRLRTLHLEANPKLTKLPKALGGVRSLETLTLGDNLTYPPAEVVGKGTEGVMRFLCQECDIPYIPPSEYQPTESEDDKNKKNGNGFYVDPYQQIVSSNLKFMDKQKEDKMKEMKAMERERLEAAAKEAKLSESMMNNKKKLLNNLADEEARMDLEVKRLQDSRDKQKSLLIDSLSNVESSTDALISHLMSNNKAHSDPKKLIEELERERKESEELFTIRAGDAKKLREEEVKREMQRAIAEEMKREQLRRKYEDGKQDVIVHALAVDLENDKAVDSVLSTKGKHQQELISNLLEDEKYQRDAFTSLLIKEDARHREISQQVEAIQNELAQLSMVEMTKKEHKMEFENNVMAEKRETLSQMLVQLMDQKSERTKELQTRLRELEDHKTAETDNYWLIQYQKLLDAKPKTMVEAESKIDPDLREVLTKAGGEDLIPIFALRNVTLKQLSYMKDHDLIDMGVTNAYLRQKVLVSAEEYVRLAAAANGGGVAASNNGGGHAPSAPQSAVGGDAPSAPPPPAETIAVAKKDVDADVTPSAPSAEGATAPPAPLAVVSTFKSTECVVCLENKCDIIFLPCGHVCCCWKCQPEVSACPLCRAAISQKVKLS